MSALRRAFIGLGTNLGDRVAYLDRAVALLQAAGDVTAVSSVYETAPVGGPPDQGPFLNCVVALRTADSPRRLLERCQELEADARRVRLVHHGPRTLDADVLLVGDEVVNDPDLVVPHPRWSQRQFVLVPLAELAPDLVAPQWVEASGEQVVRVGTLSGNGSLAH